MTPDFQTDLALILAYLERQYLPPAEREAMRRIALTIDRVFQTRQPPQEWSDGTFKPPSDECGQDDGLIDTPPANGVRVPVPEPAMVMAGKDVL